jgi:hypothetical protein
MNMPDRLRTLPSIALGIAVCSSALARPVFNASQIDGQGSEIIFCNLNEDRLMEALLLEGPGLAIFYQDAKRGFARKPQQQFRLDDRPSVFWPARLQTNAESLLVMTSEGVTEVSFPSRTDPPARRGFIKEKTIIPAALDEPQSIHFPLSAETGNGWPLLLLPVASGFQVWRHDGTWRQSQIIEQSIDSHIRPSVTNAGYTQAFQLSVSLSDVNHDRRDDLMVMRHIAGARQTYALYLQQADGLFTSRPAQTYTNRADGHSALCWVDINRDGKVDLIKGTPVEEPFFVPGMRSSKVLVGVYLADERGRIPADPQQIFRKSDWSSSLPVVDVDADGFVELALGHIPLNTREGFREMAIARKFQFNLKLYFYRPGAGFPDNPDCQRDVSIHFDRKFFAAFGGELDPQQLFSLDGDFNGDGRKDLMVRDHGDEISVYFFLGREKGFSPKADLRFTCIDPIEWCQAKDLNGDGVSDLIVKLLRPGSFWMFTSQGK